LNSFRPQFTILPKAQSELWKQLGWARREGFVLYGGTAIALQLGHRTSVDFDFFSSETLNHGLVFRNLETVGIDYLVLQQEPTALTVRTLPGNVLLSFFGTIDFGCVRDPIETEDQVMVVASLLDLFGTKLKVILQRIQAKDYVDIGALLTNGYPLEDGLAAATCLYGKTFSPGEALKALTYFEGADLATVTPPIRSCLRSAVSTIGEVPKMAKSKDRLSEGIR